MFGTNVMHASLPGLDTLYKEFSNCILRSIVFEFHEEDQNYLRHLWTGNRLATSSLTYKLVDQSADVLVGVFYREELQRVIPNEGQYTILKRRKRKGSKES